MTQQGILKEKYLFLSFKHRNLVFCQSEMWVNCRVKCEWSVSELWVNCEWSETDRYESSVPGLGLTWTNRKVQCKKMIALHLSSWGARLIIPTGARLIIPTRDETWYLFVSPLHPRFQWCSYKTKAVVEIICLPTWPIIEQGGERGAPRKGT